MTTAVQLGRERCARSSDWCDGVECITYGVGCPNAERLTVAEVAERRGCVGPYPCGRGAGANGRDLPCDCEAMARA